MTARAISLTERVTTRNSSGASAWTAPANEFRVLLNALERLGYQVDTLVAAAGFRDTDLSDPDTRVPCEAYPALISRAQQLRFTPNLALELARLTPMGAYPLLDYLVLTSETVGAGVRQLAHYFRLVGNPVVISAREDVDPIRVEISAPALSLQPMQWSIGSQATQRAPQSANRRDWSPPSLRERCRNHRFRLTGARFDNPACVSYPPRESPRRDDGTNAANVWRLTMRKDLIRGMVLVGVVALATSMWGTRSGRSSVLASDAETNNCPVKQQTLKTALSDADADDSTGLNNHYWAVVVNREGVVCAVAFSGPGRDSQWLLSRQIAAAKAFTANGLSLDGAPLSTAQLYPWVQPGAPGNPLFGLAAGNPVSPDDAYKGPFSQFGTKDDPMVGKRVGGTITFGGGLGLYSGTSAVGGLGLSGDTACADHSTAWRLRSDLGLAPASGDDRITLNNATGHPHCPNDAGTQGAH